ncbi:hypothetical protein DAPPUDRAFT_99209 [Daphnia pulex]|uniref:Uncharacterized protein n=1 Tax=Daphnia pulex TaxID=6669 RepID=E9G610_DAPPU|nr:hypothetical protein DAPPUDRAFT_99209 [Daphnia pulex]|eukprot:EFX84857.1 hypothetical protein DAPPUDRAFT_99209 [Daphnia pulex]
MFKGLGVDAFREFLSSSFIADIPCEVWDDKVFDNLKNYAVDIILQMEDCPEFWKSFDPSNNVQIFHKPETSLTPTALNHQLFWRGSVKMRDPHNPSNFGHLEHAELSYGFDQLDLLTSQIREENFPFIATRKKTFCSFLELVSSFDANTVPFVFYTSTSLVLTVQGADPFWKAMDEKVSFLFRLDFATEETEHRGKETGMQSLYFLSHWSDDELRLYLLKGADQLQNLANIFVGLHHSTSFSSVSKVYPSELPVNPPTSTDHLRMDRLEKETRRLQLHALQAWIKENGAIDLSTMNELLDEVAVAVAKEHHRFAVKAIPERTDWPEFSEAELLKWKLEKKMTSEGDRPATMNNRLLQPGCNGRVISVDVNSLLRCFNRKQQPSRSPKKVRASECVAATRLKPSCDSETAQTTEWPKSAALKFPGIHYNLSVEDEKAEKQRSEFQDKWVPPETSTATWCNPWSVNSSSSYQLSIKTRPPAPAAAEPPVASRAPRTPKKNQQQPRDLAQLRKSPRLLAKSGGPPTRASKRTPSKKNTNGSAAAAGASAAFPKDTFKQQLKAVIIKVLGDQQITTKDPLFRTCANKLSVICMALLNDSKSDVTPRQMYQVAKSQAKQVLQFVKP